MKCILNFVFEVYFAYNMDPDQTSSLGVVWSGFIVIAYLVESF